jgi:maltose O-acetyltransferase
MSIKDKIKTILFGYKATEETYLTHLRNSGVKLGTNIKIFRPFNTTIDVQNPHLLTIGNDVQITGPVTILTHDYSWSVLKKKYGIIYGNQRKTVIGNNVFIRWGATILGGSHIGDNVIIGANSVVSGNVDSNSVYAGNPARKLMTLEEYRDKREKRQLKEAVEYVLEYKKRFKTYPPEEKMDEYFFLFRPSKIFNEYRAQLELMRNFDKSLKKLNNSNTQFLSYKEFLNYCKKQKMVERK